MIGRTSEKNYEVYVLVRHAHAHEWVHTRIHTQTNKKITREVEGEDHNCLLL